MLASTRACRFLRRLRRRRRRAVRGGNQPAPMDCPFRASNLEFLPGIRLCPTFGGRCRRCSGCHSRLLERTQWSASQCSRRRDGRDHRCQGLARLLQPQPCVGRNRAQSERRQTALSGQRSVLRLAAVCRADTLRKDSQQHGYYP